MRRMIPLLVLVGIVAAAVLCVVVIDEREHAFRTVRGEADSPLNFGRSVLSEPGLYLRIPGVHVLNRYDKRLQRYDAADADELQLAGRKPERAGGLLLLATGHHGSLG